MLKLIIHFLLLLCITNAFEFASTNNKIYSGASQQLYHHRAEDVTIIRPKNDLEYILPRTTKPIHYEIYIRSAIDKNDFDFQGEVTIEIEITTESTDQIVLHSLVSIDEIILYENDGNTIELNTETIDEELQFLTINIKDRLLLLSETYFVHIKYHGTLRGDGKDFNGFYRASYINSEGELKWFATTHFVPFHTRHAFPCYDEPSLKAKFTITIDHGCSYNAISNMPETKNILLGDAGCRTTFTTTPIMPTYLIAFVISDFESIASYDLPLIDNVVRHRLFANELNINDTFFGLYTHIYMLEQIQNYFDYKFVLPKLDTIGIPAAQYPVGAMENWGLITYREQTLHAEQTIMKKFPAVRTISHELTHKWFGNLVTPAEFSYLWLKEGFATLFGSLAPNRYYNEMRYADNLIQEVCQNVKSTDALRTTRSMSYEVHERNAIQAIFDNIAYDKAGCVLNMILHAITEDQFQKALNFYLNENEFSFAYPNDLSSAIHEVVKSSLPENVNFNEILETWHSQSGFPYVIVNYNHETNIIQIEQNRFISNPDLNIQDETLYWIPLNYLFQSEIHTSLVSETKSDVWFSEKSSSLTPTEDRNWENHDGWVLFNKGQTGYYRVNYDLENWKKLITFLKESSIEDFERFPILSRSQLIEDSYELAEIEMLDYQVFLSLIDYLPRETDFAPWLTGFWKMRSLINNLHGTVSHDYMLNYITKIVANEYDTSSTKFNILEINELDYYSNRHLSELINFACESNIPKCLTDTKAALDAYINGNLILSDIIVERIVIQGARTLSQDNFNKLFDLYVERVESGIGADVSILRQALVSTENENLIESLLKSGLDLVVNNDEKYSIIAAAIKSYEWFDLTLDFLLSTYGDLPQFEQYSSVVLNAFVSRIFTETRLEQVDPLIEIYKSLNINVTSYYINVERNIKWTADNGGTVSEWFTENGYDSGASGLLVSTILFAFCMIVMIF